MADQRCLFAAHTCNAAVGSMGCRACAEGVPYDWSKDPGKLAAERVERSADVRALSLIQPWADAILDGGKRVENRVKWSGSSFRGPLLLHASKGMTKQDYTDVWAFVAERGIPWRPKPGPEIVRGGIVGRANVVGVVRPSGWMGGGACPAAIGPADAPTVRALTDAERVWWMGAFALVLADVERVPFVACSGALGFWRVPADVVAAIGKAA